VFAAGKHDPERHLGIGQMIAIRATHLVRVDEHLERFRFGTARGQDVDIDRRATADRGKKQFCRREVSSAAAAKAKISALVAINAASKAGG